MKVAAVDEEEEVYLEGMRRLMSLEAMMGRLLFEWSATGMKDGRNLVGETKR